MLSLKLVRSLVLGESINNPLHLHNNEHNNHTQTTKTITKSKSKSKKTPKTKTPILIFLPTKQLIKDTYTLATIARDMGMDLFPTPSLSHIIFASPQSTPSPSSSSSSSFPPLWSSSSSSWPFSDDSEDAVPLPFPSLIAASTAQLRRFVNLSKGLFKLAFINSNCDESGAIEIGICASTGDGINWDCSVYSLFSRITCCRISDMDGFSRALAGKGWTLFKTKSNPVPDSGECRVRGGNSVFLYRKVESNRVQVRMQTNGEAENLGEFRVRELRLPQLDFRNAPLRILQYILLMTDDIFYLASK